MKALISRVFEVRLLFKMYKKILLVTQFQYKFAIFKLLATLTDPWQILSAVLIPSDLF